MDHREVVRQDFDVTAAPGRGTPRSDRSPASAGLRSVCTNRSSETPASLAPLGRLVRRDERILDVDLVGANRSPTLWVTRSKLDFEYGSRPISIALASASRGGAALHPAMDRGSRPDRPSCRNLHPRAAPQSPADLAAPLVHLVESTGFTGGEDPFEHSPIDVFTEVGKLRRNASSIRFSLAGAVSFHVL